MRAGRAVVCEEAGRGKKSLPRAFASRVAPWSGGAALELVPFDKEGGSYLVAQTEVSVDLSARANNVLAPAGSLFADRGTLSVPHTQAGAVDIGISMTRTCETLLAHKREKRPTTRRWVDW